MSEPNRPQVFAGIFWDGTSRPVVTLPVSCYKNSAEEPRKEKPRMGKWVHFLVCPNSPYSFIEREVSQEDKFGCLFANGSFRSRQPELLSGTKNAPSCGRDHRVNILGNNILSDYPAEMRDLSDRR